MPSFKKIVKALSHENSGVERRLSRSQRVLTDGKTQMSPRNLNAKLNIVNHT